MAYSDRTEMGGPAESFRTTQWTQMASLDRADEARRQGVLADLVRRYWKPVYSFLRRKGHGDGDAKDLTQGFFTEVVFGRDLASQADRAKGRFRTFLLTALERYVVDVHRFESARKRRPVEGLVPLDAMDPQIVRAESQAADPSAAFQHAWARTLVSETLARLEAEYVSGGKQAHWQLFRTRVALPILEDQPPPGLPELCARYGVANEEKASNMIKTAKRRFRSILKQRVRESVESSDQVDGELSELMRILSGDGARS